MNIKNILRTLCVLFFVASCSMEDDILNGVGPEGSDVTGASEVYAVVDLSLTSDRIQSKSISFEDEKENPDSQEVSVWSFYVAVLNADNDDKVLTTYYCTDIRTLGSGHYTIKNGNGHFICKIPASKPRLKFYVIANIYNGKDGAPDNVSELNKCKDLTALKNARLVDVDPNIMPKSGIKTLDNYPTYTSLADIDHLADDNCPSVEVPLSQSTARIQLARITVNDQPVDNITVFSLKLSNRKQYTLAGREFEATSNDTQSGWSFVPFGVDSEGIVSNGDFRDLSNYSNIHFYTYENTSSTFKTTLEVEYQIGNEPQRSYSFEIKTPERGSSVIAGNVYQLYLNVKNSVAQGTIICKTKDWQEGGNIELPAIE